MRIVLILLLSISAFSFGQRTDFKNVNFTKADSIALIYKGGSLENLPILSHNLTKDLAQNVEKFRSIYTWVCTNIENDYSSYLRTSKKRKKLADDRDALLQWNNDYLPKVFNKLVKERKTACTGYAFLLRELARLSNLNCVIIDGYGRTASLNLNENSLPNHSWNAIKLNGKWYLCDPTWSAGRILLEENGARFESDYYDGYFLADPQLFLKNHYPIDDKWALTNNLPSFINYIEGPIVYKEAFKPNIIPMSPEKMKIDVVKNQKVSFKLKHDENINNNTIYLLIDRGSGNKKTTPEITSNKEILTLEHTFTKTGIHDVHIAIDDVIIATYVLTVKRK
ncbi:transglutaminase domain-containing protein [Aurantibacter sp.]|uniref:transglutaminase domain-containing protein n=1 Tax=Aurantibacter sp. TaxID=2807103 RepID=UPI0032658661